MLKLSILLISILFLFFGFSYAENVKVFEFTKEEYETLKVRKIRGADNKTEYSIGKNENGNFLKAISNNSGSGLGKEVIIDLNKTPYLNITWKVEKDLNGINERSKKGHDYAARVFVVKKNRRDPFIQ